MGADTVDKSRVIAGRGGIGSAGRQRFTSLASRLASSRTAIVLGAIELALIVLAITIASLAGTLGGAWAEIALAFSFLGVGLIVAYVRPQHRIGWILLGGSFFTLLFALGAAYSVLDYRVHQGNLPLGPVAVLIEPSWAPAIVLLGLALILFPEGRLPTPRWRWPVRWLLSIAAAWQLGAFAIAVDAIASGNIRVLASGDLAQIDKPAGAWAWWGVVQDLFFATLALMLIAWIVGQTRGYRHLEGERRIQQKWLLGGAGICVVGAFLIMPSVFSSSAVAGTIANIAPVAGCALPLAIGVGILKFRLYDIDRVISRTLSYAILTALLVGTFVGLVVLTTDALPFSSTVGVAASTLAAFALFNPLRRRVQRAVDRRFNRARYDAEQTVAAFAARLRDAVDLDAVQDDLLDVVRRAVEPSHATIWLRPHVRSGKAPAR